MIIFWSWNIKQIVSKSMIYRWSFKKFLHIILVQYGHNRNGKNWNHLLNRHNWVIVTEIYVLDNQNRSLSSAVNNILFHSLFLFLFCLNNLWLIIIFLKVIFVWIYGLKEWFIDGPQIIFIILFWSDNMSEI